MKHILILPHNLPLCGNINREYNSILYGDQCGECFEIAQKVIRGQIKLEDLTNPIPTIIEII